MEAEKRELGLCDKPELVDLFLSYIVGDVESDERERIEKHLAECAACREHIQFFTDLQRVGEEQFGEDQPK